MKELIIVGAGGHGIEIAWLARRCNRVIKGFLDNTPEKQNQIIADLRVLGTLDKRNDFMDCEFVIAVGSPRARKNIVCNYFNSSIYKFATLVDPTAIIGENVKISEGSMICARSILTIDVQIGKHTIVNINSTISHGCSLGDYVTLAPNASVSGDIDIANLVEIGASAVVKEKIKIKEGALVGMGSVVTKNIDRNCVVVGNPSKFLKILD